MTLNKMKKISVVATSVTVVAILLTSFSLSQGVSSKQLHHMIYEPPGTVHAQWTDFKPCYNNSAFTKAPGNGENAAIVRRGQATTIHICAFNMDSSSRTYKFDLIDVGNPFFNATNPKPISLRSESGNPQNLQRDGIHVTFPKKVTITGWSQGKGIPDTAHLKPQDFQSFYRTYMSGKKPDVDHFDISVSTDKNATLGIHAFMLGSSSSPTVAGDDVFTEIIYINVVP